MGIKKRKYSKEQKEEVIQRALSGKRILALGKENNISPGLINRWKRQYLDGELSNNTNQEVKKLAIQVAKLEYILLLCLLSVVVTYLCFILPCIPISCIIFNTFL